MCTLPLICHPATPSRSVWAFDVRAIRLGAEALSLHYNLRGTMDALRIPEPAVPARRDRLWEHTCLEVFIGVAGSTGYCEFNFSPSSDWAAYRFGAYREGMVVAPIAHPPRVTVRKAPERLDLDVVIEGVDALFTEQKGGLKLGVSAVVEESTGALSYWALWHPSAAPDFHHAEGFVLMLEPDRAALIPREGCS